MKTGIQHLASNLKLISRATIFLFSVTWQNQLFSQAFTQVTDPNNPVVTETGQSGGGSWIDINHDGLLDLFVSKGNLMSANNSLFLNEGNGNFKKIITGNIVTDGGSSIGSTWADYDNDGNLDCFVTNRGSFGCFLYRGTGDTIFQKITSGAIVTDKNDGNSGSWVDVTNKGTVDLAEVNFQENNVWYQNQGVPGYNFSANSSAAICTDNTNFSINGVWSDYNNDNLQDLFIGNSGTQNDGLYKNNGDGSFTVTTLTDLRSSLGSSWGDFNNDGNMDLVVTNFTNEGSYLYVNSGPPDHNLVRMNTGPIADFVANSVGSAWGDFDNDGDLDLFIANDGATSGLFENSGAPDYKLTKITTGPEVTNIGNSFGCVWTDYDNDGQLDLFVANEGSKNFLYHNNGNSNHWITIRCVGVESNRAAIGAKVYVKATIRGVPEWQLQQVEGQTGYNSQNLWLHFGFDSTSVIDSAKIIWPSGIIDQYAHVATNQFYTATEGASLTGINQQASYATQPFQLFPNPTHSQFYYQINKAARISIDLIAVDGKAVRLVSESFRSAGRYLCDLSRLQLHAGVYIVRLNTGAEPQFQKLILE